MAAKKSTLAETSSQPESWQMDMSCSATAAFLPIECVTIFVLDQAMADELNACTPPKRGAAAAHDPILPREQVEQFDAALKAAGDDREERGKVETLLNAEVDKAIAKRGTNCGEIYSRMILDLADEVIAAEEARRSGREVKAPPLRGELEPFRQDVEAFSEVMDVLAAGANGLCYQDTALHAIGLAFRVALQIDIEPGEILRRTREKKLSPKAVHDIIDRLADAHWKAAPEDRENLSGTSAKIQNAIRNELTKLDPEYLAAVHWALADTRDGDEDQTERDRIRMYLSRRRRSAKSERL